MSHGVFPHPEPVRLARRCLWLAYLACGTVRRGAAIFFDDPDATEESVWRAAAPAPTGLDVRVVRGRPVDLHLPWGKGSLCFPVDVWGKAKRPWRRWYRVYASYRILLDSASLSLEYDDVKPVG